MSRPKDIIIAGQLPVLTIFMLLGQPWGMAHGQSENDNPNAPKVDNPSNPYDRYQYSNYNYNYDRPPGDHDYGGNDYGQNYPDTPPSKPPSYSYIQCYSCVYTIRMGHPSGMENCNDPFDRADIPSVDCKGPCAKIYNQLSENEYMMNRACMPKCREHRDATSYTQCCVESQCNAATSSSTFQTSSLLLCVLLTLLLLARR